MVPERDADPAARQNLARPGRGRFHQHTRVCLFGSNHQRLMTTELHADTVPIAAPAEPVHTTDGSTVWRTVIRTPMRDGIVLVGDLYSAMPEPAPAPVLLERSPYGRRERRGSDGRDQTGRDITPVDSAAHFVQAGLNVFRQDSRGRGDSEGLFVKYLDERY